MNYWHWIIDERTLTAPEKLIAMVILRHQNGAGKAWPSVGRIGELAGFRERRTQSILRSLEKKNVIDAGRRRGRTTIYRVRQNQFLLYSSANSTFPHALKGVHPSAPPDGGGVQRAAPEVRSLHLEDRKERTRPAPMPPARSGFRYRDERARSEARAGKGPAMEGTVNRLYLEYLEEKDRGTFEGTFKEYQEKRECGADAWSEGREKRKQEAK